MKKLWVWLLVLLPVALAQEDPLIAAIVTQDQSKVEQLLAQGHLVNFYEDGYMPLHYAVMNQNAAVVRLLLDFGADPDYRTISRNISPGPGYTPFDLALFTFNPEIIQLLMPYATPWEISQALPTTIAHGSRKAVQDLLVRGANPNSYDDDSSVLEMAARSGHTGIVDDLIAAGASAAGANDYQRTAVMAAIEENRLDIVAWLVERGSDPNACSSFGDSPLALAAGQGQPDLVRLLLESGARVDLAQVCARQPYKVPPLVAAIQSKNVETAQILLTSGASPNTCTEAGISPLSAAAESGDPALLGLILAAGGRLELAENCAAQPYQMPPLAAAARSDNPQVVKLLIAAGAHPNTASPALAQARSNEVMDLLLAAGADLEARGFGGATPLLARATVADAAQLQHFLAAGTDPKARD